jgi:eukaryotic-like serine/threonine-protein kinase
VRPEHGAVLGGRYLLDDSVASGGMGEVWRATDQVLGRTVAVKVLKTELVDEPTFLERFRAEARSAASLSHPGIAQVYDYGEEGRSAYLVMELVPGEPLSALLHREGALGTDRALDLVAQSAWALHAAHQGGVVHRDVKPGNLLVTPDGRVKITDFGIARAADAAPLTQTGTVMGTAHYLSPEQAYGKPSTPASDVYCLGVVAFECLTGEKPFPGDNAVEVAMAQVRAPIPPLPEHVPEPVRALVTQTMAKDPADRPASGAELARRAEQLRGGAGHGALAGATPPAGTAATAALGTGAVAAAGDGPSTADFGVPPEEGSGTGEQPAAPERRRLSRRGLAALLLGALVLVAALVAFALSSDDPGGPSAPEDTASATPTVSSATPTPSEDSADGETAAPQGPETVRVDAGEYVGRPYGEVRSELSDLGLDVQPRYTESGRAAGTVTGVSPTGDVAQGSTVTVTVAEESQEQGSSSSSGSAEPEPEPTRETSAPSPSPTPTEPEPTEEPTTPAPTSESPTPAATDADEVGS